MEKTLLIEITQKFSDFETLAKNEALSEEKYREAGYNPSDWGSSRPPENIKSYYNNNLLWVALNNSKPVGHALVDVFENSAHLEELSVHPNFMRKGIGTKLLKTVIQWARSNNFSQITLRTFKTTPWSVGIYKKNEFKIIQKEKYPDYLKLQIEHEKKDKLPLEDRITMLLKL